MTSIESYLEKRAHASNSERAYLSEDGLSIAATVGLGLSHFKTIKETDLFNEWEADFSQKFNQKMDEFTERRFTDLEEYKSLLQEHNINSFEDLKESGEVESFAKRLHTNDVDSRWDFEQFFANDGNEGARRVLGFHDFEEGVSSYKHYSEEQFNQLQETGIVTVDEVTLQGHHIFDFSSNATVLDKIETLFHVNNIRLMTRTAHHQDPEYGHGGSWQNSTEGRASEVVDKKESIVDANKDITDGNIAKFDYQVGIGIGVFISAITAILEIRKLKNDPRPWKNKSLLVATSSLVRGFEAGTLALLALKTRTAISSLGESEVLHSNVELANNFLTDAFPGDLAATLDAQNIASVAGFSTSIAELRIIRSGIVAIVQWRQSDFKTAFNQFGKDSSVIVVEESAFFGVALLFDMLYQAGEDAIIPDPTGGFIIATRLAWSAGKKGYQYRENKKTMEICKQRRFDGLYETAIVSLVYLG